MLTNPLAPVFEFFLQFYSLLPLAVRSFVSLTLGLFLVNCLVSLFFRSKH